MHGPFRSSQNAAPGPGPRALRAAGLLFMAAALLVHAGCGRGDSPAEAHPGAGGRPGREGAAGGIPHGSRAGDHGSGAAPADGGRVQGHTAGGGPIARVFTEVAAEAGVAHLHHKPIFEEKVKNIEPWLASVGAAAAAADYDGDGDIDLYVTNSRKGFPNALYRNNGDGTFTDVAAEAGVARVNDKGGLTMDAVWGDYDNDGDDDLYIAKWGRNLLFRNDGKGRFTDVTAAAKVGDAGNANAAIFFDYDGDGFLDLYLGNYFRNVDLWNLPTTRIMHESFETARDGGANVLYRNNRNGTFTDVSKAAGVADTGWTLDVGAADYDNDGDMDLLIANDFGPDKLYRNEGNGRFTDVSVEAIGVDTRKGMNAEFGDFNGDGWLDIYVTNIWTKDYLKEGNMLFRNSGDGTFLDVAPEAGVLDGGWGWAAKFFDYDNDGDLDLFTVNGFISQEPGDAYWFDLATSVTEPDFDPVDARSWPTIGKKSLSGHEANRFFRNEGSEYFVEAAEKVGLLDRSDGRGVVIFDYDNDGDMDIYVTNQNQTARLYRNDLANGNRWVAFLLKGKGNAVGARVTVRAGGIVQMREVDGGNGFSSQSDRRLHFGLGRHDRIDSVEVRWPDGRTQALAGIEPGRLHVLHEP